MIRLEQASTQAPRRRRRQGRRSRAAVGIALPSAYYSGIHYSKPDGAREEKTLFVEYDWRISALRIHYFGDPFDAADPIPAIAASNTVEAAASVLSLWGLPLDSAATNAPATP